MYDCQLTVGQKTLPEEGMGNDVRKGMATPTGTGLQDFLAFWRDPPAAGWLRTAGVEVCSLGCMPRRAAGYFQRKPRLCFLVEG